MRRGISLRQVYLGGLIVIFFGVLLQGIISSASETLWPHQAVFVKAWKEIVMVGLVPIAIILLVRTKQLKQFLRDRVVVLTVIILMTTLLCGLIWNGLLPFLAGAAIDLRGFTYFLLVYAAAKVEPQFLTRFTKIALIGSTFVVGLSLLEWFVLPKGYLHVFGYSRATIAPYLTVDDYPGLIRLQSSLRGPNPLGAIAVIASLLSVSIITLKRVTTRMKMFLTILFVASVAVAFGSYSRSAYIGLIVALAIFAGLYIAQHKRLARTLLIPMGVLVVVVLVGAFMFKDSSFVKGTILHQVPGYGPSVDSNQGHASSIMNALSQIKSHPLGEGVGSTGSASLLGHDQTIVENQFLFVAHETGWLGCLLFILWLGMVLKRAFTHRGYPLALTVFLSGISLIIIGLLLPVFADDTVAIVWFGMAGCISAIIKGINDDRFAKQETTGTT